MAEAAKAKAGKSTWRKSYEPDDDGLRFQDLKFVGNFKDEEPLPDGILGDRLIKARFKTKVMSEKLPKEHLLKDEYTIPELNDYNDYVAWNIWDCLVMRATEGVSGMIPRQEYEILAFMQEYYRYPEFMREMTDQLGAQGIIDIGATARREIGTKINCVHDWCLSSCTMGMGRCGLLALEVMQPDDYVENSNILAKFSQRVLWGKRQDGWTYNSQDRYRCRPHEKDFLDGLLTQCEDFEPGSDTYQKFVSFNAQAELLAFFSHYDCRLGLGDTGPYELPDGRILIVRDLFTNEDIFHWTDVCEGLPHAYTMMVLLDPELMGLKELRVNDISTTFTIPKNYIEAISGGAIFVREKHDTPMSEIYTVPIMETADILEKIQKATFDMYKKTAKMSRHELCLNGIYSYYIEMIVPHMRKAGMYDYFCQEKNFWEIDQRIANYYYDINHRGFAQTVVPQKIFSGEGYERYSDKADIRSAKYFFS